MKFRFLSSVKEDKPFDKFEQDFMDIYEECYPEGTCRYSVEDFRRMLSLSGSECDFDIQCIGMYTDNKEPVGFIVGTYYKKCNTALIDVLCVKDEFRHNGYANELVEYYKSMVDVIAHVRLQNYGVGLILAKNADGTNNDSAGVAFAKKYSYKFLRLFLLQMKSSNRYEPLSTCVVFSKQHMLTQNTVDTLLKEYLCYNIGLPSPETTKEYTMMRTLLQS